MRVLVISPHPDDESIGCGGTLRKHVVEGDLVEVVFLTSGEMGVHGVSPGEAGKIREAEAARAAKILGIHDLEFWREADGKLKLRRPLVSRLREKLELVRPDRVYVTNPHEQHPDHRAAARLVRAALRGLPTEISPQVLAFEVWTPLREMDEIVDITPYVERKREAISAYRSQCEVLAFDEAFVGLARYRGAMHCWPEGDFAEVFEGLSM